MSTYSDAELEYAMGNLDKARRILRQIIRRDPTNTDAWQLLLDSAENDAERERARAGLRKAEAAVAGSWDSPPPAATGESTGGSFSTVEPSGEGGTFTLSEGSAPTTSTFSWGADADSYVPYAVGSLIASFIFPILGVAGAVIFLIQAQQRRRNGETPEGVGCLWAVIAGNVVVFFGTIALIVLIAVLGAS